MNGLDALKLNITQNTISDFGPLYDYYFPKVYNYVRYRVQDAQLSDDLTSQVFERVLVKYKTYDENKAPFEVWLFRIAHNIVVDHFRREKRRQWVSLDFLRNHAADTPSPDEIAHMQDDKQRVLAAVAHLKRREQHILALKFGASLTNRQISALLNLTESNVGVLLHRSLNKLRQLMEAEND